MCKDASVTLLEGELRVLKKRLQNLLMATGVQKHGCEKSSEISTSWQEEVNKSKRTAEPIQNANLSRQQREAPLSIGFL